MNLLRFLAASAAWPSLAGAAFAEGRPGWTKEQVEVWRTIEAWNNAFEANDAAAFLRLWPGVAVSGIPTRGRSLGDMAVATSYNRGWRGEGENASMA
jgi:hypothetical protein